MSTTNETVYTIKNVTLSGKETMGGTVTIRTNYDDNGRLDPASAVVTAVNIDVAGGNSSAVDTPNSKGFNAKFNDATSITWPSNANGKSDVVSGTDHLGANITLDAQGNISLTLQQTSVGLPNTVNDGKTFDNFDSLKISFKDTSITTPSPSDSINGIQEKTIDVNDVYWNKFDASTKTTFTSTGGIDHIDSEAVTVCYVKGTLVLTGNGLVAVESLKVGDLINTISGNFKPLVWLGFNTINCALQKNQDHAYPVRIAQHAFGYNLPSQDLYVSPLHSIYVSGVMIPAIHLVNDLTITQDRKETFVTYYHLELPQHDVIYANDLPAETYLDTSPENRNFFKTQIDNSQDINKQFPACPQGVQVWQHIWDTQGYAPLTQSGPILEAVKASLIEHAVLLDQNRQRLAA